ncbi:YwaF family protein [Alkalihalobacterium elongatum]|uniref:YwaF family protein n=1 Tax=Alkalihalobacterium elongatum TaxID=2675466 RepID=UPI001C1F282D|nr:TIGR02206 family membrane protein [Alkalihalobacterium elongatum]
MFEEFFNPAAYMKGTIFLSPAHIASLILFLLSLIWMFVHRDRPYMGKIRWWLLSVLVISELSIIMWSIAAGLWDIRYNLPLQLCTISIYLSSVMLITRSYRIFEFIYFFGIGGALQALITPELFYTFPHYRFWHFFIAHIAIILAILYMIWIHKYTVTWKSAMRSFVFLNILAFIAFWVNYWTGANYMFLARKPDNPSILDWLGPYPWYILSLEVIVILMFTLLYLPFYLKEKYKNN